MSDQDIYTIADDDQSAVDILRTEGVRFDAAWQL